jgi:hypothetical protein
MICSTNGCTRLVHARGLCRKHYDQWRFATAGSRALALEDAREEPADTLFETSERLASALSLLHEAHDFVVYCQNHPNLVLDNQKVAALAERLDNFLRSNYDQSRT